MYYMEPVRKFGSDINPYWWHLADVDADGNDLLTGEESYNRHHCANVVEPSQGKSTILASYTTPYDYVHISKKVKQYGGSRTIWRSDTYPARGKWDLCEFDSSIMTDDAGVFRGIEYACEISDRGLARIRPEQRIIPKKCIDCIRTLLEKTIIIVDMPANSHYAMLSYVWRLHNMDQQSIDEVCTACVSDYIRYLWIDKLCISQNDREKVDSELLMLPRIVYHATVVYIHADLPIRDGFFIYNSYNSWLGRCWTKVENIFARNIKVITTINREFAKMMCDRTMVGKSAYLEADIKVRQKKFVTVRSTRSISRYSEDDMWSDVYHRMYDKSELLVLPCRIYHDIVAFSLRFAGLLNVTSRIFDDIEDTECGLIISGPNELSFIGKFVEDIYYTFKDRGNHLNRNIFIGIMNTKPERLNDRFVALGHCFCKDQASYKVNMSNDYDVEYVNMLRRMTPKSLLSVIFAGYNNNASSLVPVGSTYSVDFIDHRRIRAYYIDDCIVLDTTCFRLIRDDGMCSSEDIIFKGVVFIAGSRGRLHKICTRWSVIDPCVYITVYKDIKKTELKCTIDVFLTMQESEGKLNLQCDLDSLWAVRLGSKAPLGKTIYLIVCHGKKVGYMELMHSYGTHPYKGTISQSVSKHWHIF